MSQALLEHAPVIRLSVFVGILVLMAAWEVAAPRRPRRISRVHRWPGNLGIVVLNSLALRVVAPTAALGLAAQAQARGWGLLHLIALPDWAVVTLSVILLDFAIWAQHVLFHAVPLLWRLHRMHHADLELDVTSGGRFHTVEILLSAGIKLAAVAALGAPPLAVLVFEVLLNATSMFNHSNVRIPDGVERWLRLWVVTPDMHRVHHSIEEPETNSNFGFNLPWWDRLFGTYRAQPRLGHEGMVIGIEQFRDPRELRLDRMLLQPLRGEVGAYPLNSESRR